MFKLPLQAEDIIKSLPHRYPFLMVDRVVELVPGKRAVAVKTLTADRDMAVYPGCGLSPEMLVLEAMAQVGAVAYAFSLPGYGLTGVGHDEKPAVNGYLAGLNDVVFHVRPRAGDILELTLEYVAAMGLLARFGGTARISGAVAVEAGLTFSVEGER